MVPEKFLPVKQKQPDVMVQQRAAFIPQDHYQAAVTRPHIMGRDSKPALTRSQIQKLMAAPVSVDEHFTPTHRRSRYRGFLIRRNYDQRMSGGTHRLQVHLETVDGDRVEFEIEDTKYKETSMEEMTLSVRDRATRGFYRNTKPRVISSSQYDQLANNGHLFYGDILSKSLQEIVFHGEGAYAGCTLKLYIGNRRHVNVHKILAGLIVEGKNKTTQKEWLTHFNEEALDLETISEDDFHMIQIYDKTIEINWPQGDPAELCAALTNWNLFDDPLYPNKQCYLMMPTGKVVRLSKKENTTGVEIKANSDVETYPSRAEGTKIRVSGINEEDIEVHVTRTGLEWNVELDIDQAFIFFNLNGICFLNIKHQSCYAIHTIGQNNLVLREITLAEYFSHAILHDNLEDTIHMEAWCSKPKQPAQKPANENLPAPIVGLEPLYIDSCSIKLSRASQGPVGASIHLNLLNVFNAYIVISPFLLMNEDGELRRSEPDSGVMTVRSIKNGQLTPTELNVYYDPHSQLLKIAGIGVIHIGDMVSVNSLDTAQPQGLAELNIYDEDSLAKIKWLPWKNIASPNSKPFSSKKPDVWDALAKKRPANVDQFLTGLAVHDVILPEKPRSSTDSTSDLVRVALTKGEAHSVCFSGQFVKEHFSGHRLPRVPMWDFALPILWQEGSIQPLVSEIEGQKTVQLTKLTYRGFHRSKRGRKYLRQVTLPLSAKKALYHSNGDGWFLSIKLGSRILFFHPLSLERTAANPSMAIGFYITSEPSETPSPQLKSAFKEKVSQWHLPQIRDNKPKPAATPTFRKRPSSLARKSSSVQKAEKRYQDNGSLWFPQQILSPSSQSIQEALVAAIITKTAQTVRWMTNGIETSYQIGYSKEKGFYIVPNSVAIKIGDQTTLSGTVALIRDQHGVLTLEDGQKFLIHLDNESIYIETTPHQIKKSQNRRFLAAIANKKDLHPLEETQPYFNSPLKYQQNLFRPSAHFNKPFWQFIEFESGHKLGIQFEAVYPSEGDGSITDPSWIPTMAANSEPWATQVDSRAKHTISVQWITPQGETVYGTLPAQILNRNFDGVPHNLIISNFRGPPDGTRELIFPFDFAVFNGLLWTFPRNIGSSINLELVTLLNDKWTSYQAVQDSFSEESLQDRVKWGYIRLIADEEEKKEE